MWNVIIMIRTFTDPKRTEGEEDYDIEDLNRWETRHRQKGKNYELQMKFVSYIFVLTSQTIFVL